VQQAFGLNIPQTLEDICDSTRLALVVYDMQVGIVKQIENGQQITDKVVQVPAAARKAGIRVFFTRHMSLPRELMSAFEGTPLNIALRDCGIDTVAIVGIAMEIGIEPTVRHGADLGYIPVVVKDTCGFGHREAAERSIASLEFAGDALLTNADTFCTQLGRNHSA
jgi:biuret amidohydrolase